MGQEVKLPVIIQDSPDAGYKLYELGEYYKEHNQYEIMKKYYDLAFAKGYLNAYVRKGLYYLSIGDICNMEKCYGLAIEKGSSEAMYQLAIYSEKNKDFKRMKRYLLMAKFNGHQKSIKKLRYYMVTYRDIENLENTIELQKNTIEFYKKLLSNSSIPKIEEMVISSEDYNFLRKKYNDLIIENGKLKEELLKRPLDNNTIEIEIGREKL